MNGENKENMIPNEVSSNNTNRQNNIYVNSDAKTVFISDSELLYKFMGNNYQKFIIGKFNFPVLLLSVFYLLYRKMYFYSFVVTVLYVLLLIFVKDTLYLLVGVIVINILLCLFTNKLYIRHCRTKIDNIRYKHSFFGNEEMLEQCKKSGGTSIISIIVGFVINILIIFLLIGLYFYFIEKVSINDIFNRVVDLFKDIYFCK